MGDDGEVGDGVESVDPASLAESGQLHGFTLRFRDDDVEREFQLVEGAKGLIGFKIAALAAAILWAIAAVVIPFATGIPAQVAWIAGGSMSVASLACYLFGRRATTLDRQHFAISWLTAGNGLVIIAMGVAAAAFRGYVVGGIMLLFMFGFVAGTRFIYALMRTVVIGVGFTAAALTYPEQTGLALDVFLLATASIANVLGLRRSESERRRLHYQQLVIIQQSEALELEKEETERLLLNILPKSISLRLRRGESPIADSFPSVSVLFADLQGFTPYAAKLPPAEVTMLLSELFICFDDLVSERGLEKIKTIGDAYMAAGGLPDPLEDHALRVVDLGVAMIESTRELCARAGLDLRVGINSGPVSGGVVGRRKFAYDIWGPTVNKAARLQTTGLAGRVQVSDTTHDLTTAAFDYEPRGEIELQGLGPVRTFLVASRRTTGETPSGVELSLEATTGIEPV